MSDGDEIRRLLYMALNYEETNRDVERRGFHELVASLVNALAHHGAGLDPDVVAAAVIDAIEMGRDSPGAEWVRGQIARINEELGNG
jgi:adenylylsulfate kinase-like enzyme